MEGKKREEARACPFVDSPMENCYCNDLRSPNVEKIVFFCGHQYTKCPIYCEEEALKKRRQHLE